MKCINCGIKNKDDIIFCSNCGHSLENEEKDEKDEEKIIENNSFADDSMGFKEKGIVFFILVIGLIAFSLLFNFVFSK